MATERPTDEELELWRVRLQDRNLPMSSADVDKVLWTIMPSLIEEVAECRLEAAAGPGLPPPPRSEWPCFVYGIFKPGELGFHRIAPFVTARTDA